MHVKSIAIKHNVHLQCFWLRVPRRWQTNIQLDCHIPSLISRVVHIGWWLMSQFSIINFFTRLPSYIAILIPGWVMRQRERLKTTQTLRSLYVKSKHCSAWGKMCSERLTQGLVVTSCNVISFLYSYFVYLYYAIPYRVDVRKQLCSYG